LVPHTLSMIEAHYYQHLGKELINKRYGRFIKITRKVGKR
jgi:hypothetical protein